MSDIREAKKTLIARLLEGAGVASLAQRRAAFDDAGAPGPMSALVQKVCERAHAIGDDDIAAVREANLGEDEIFEIVVCAAAGEANRQHEGALAALRAAVARERA